MVRRGFSGSLIPCPMLQAILRSDMPAAYMYSTPATRAGGILCHPDPNPAENRKAASRTPVPLPVAAPVPAHAVPAGGGPASGTCRQISAPAPPRRYPPRSPSGSPAPLLRVCVYSRCSCAQRTGMCAPVRTANGPPRTTCRSRRIAPRTRHRHRLIMPGLGDYRAAPLVYARSAPGPDAGGKRIQQIKSGFCAFLLGCDTL